jgi:hypothetical protein
MYSILQQPTPLRLVRRPICYVAGWRRSRPRRQPLLYFRPQSKLKIGKYRSLLLK